jgi:hypothetical protein
VAGTRVERNGSVGMVVGAFQRDGAVDGLGQRSADLSEIRRPTWEVKRGSAFYTVAA